jgi:lipid II:glycine glycyltransferase (peptidoglycan interpeptide bridge formation enzyme)
MVAHLKRQGAFAVKIGPRVEIRHWEAATVKQAIAEKTPSLRDAPADWTNPHAERAAAALRRLGWRPPQQGKGFAAGQPQYVFQLPLDGKDDDQLLKGFNQLWRRNVKKADKAGVSVSQGSYDDLVGFHEVYRETAERDGFTPRPLTYFQRMWRAMKAEDDDRIRLYLALHDGDLLAATTMVRVGTHAWYSYGASSNKGRDVRPSNAIQWRMMRDARDAGASVYDLRGITDTLDADDKLFGLIQFKVGTGGRAVEYLGEWDLPVNRPLSKAFDLYLARRG